jgi:hypothetical protein
VTASELDSYISRCVTYKEESRFDIRPTSRCAAASAATVFCYWSKGVNFLRYLCLLSTPETLQVYRYRSNVIDCMVGISKRLVNLTRNNFKTKLKNLGFAKYSQKTFAVFAL